MPDLKWIPCDAQPPAPGEYLTRRDLSVKILKHGLRQCRAVIQPARFDGQKWNLPVQPDYYRALPNSKENS